MEKADLLVRYPQPRADRPRAHFFNRIGPTAADRREPPQARVARSFASQPDCCVIPANAEFTSGRETLVAPTPSPWQFSSSGRPARGAHEINGMPNGRAQKGHAPTTPSFGPLSLQFEMALTSY